MKDYYYIIADIPEQSRYMQIFKKEPTTTTSNLEKRKRSYIYIYEWHIRSTSKKWKNGPCCYVQIKLRCIFSNSDILYLNGSLWIIWMVDWAIPIYQIYLYLLLTYDIWNEFVDQFGVVTLIAADQTHDMGQIWAECGPNEKKMYGKYESQCLCRCV